MKLKRYVLAANDAAQAILANAADGGSPFAILQPDGFFVPYGEFPHKLGLQRFDKAAAEEMVANHNGMLNKIVSWARGKSASYPVYIGHPDLPGSKDTDKRAYGWIEDMIAENDGLRLPVKWSDAGRELVENGHFRFYSPLWWTKPAKRGVVQPVSLKSMGLTNDPNIPVPALANEADQEDDMGDEDESQQQNNDMDLTKMIEMLGLPPEATYDDVLAALSAVLKDKADAAAANQAKLDADVAKLKAEEEKQKAEQDKVAAENSASTARNKIVFLESALTAAANAAVDAAVKSGKITTAERDAKVSELLAANDFATALQDLGKLEAKVKTSSVTGNLGGEKSRLVQASNDAAAAARAERATLVENEFQNTNPTLSLGERKRIAWERAQKKNPEVFGKKESSGSAA